MLRRRLLRWRDWLAQENGIAEVLHIVSKGEQRYIRIRREEQERRAGDAGTRRNFGGPGARAERTGERAEKGLDTRSHVSSRVCQTAPVLRCTVRSACSATASCSAKLDKGLSLQLLVDGLRCSQIAMEQLT